MTSSKLASVAALLGGLVWLVNAALTWGDSGSGGDLYLVGQVGLVLGAAGLGYSLVAKAPIWLRAVVTVATVLLCYLLWYLIDDGLGEHPVSTLIGGAVLLLAAIVGLARARSAAPRPHAGGHRAVR
jgi:hypothetical protein